MERKYQKPNEEIIQISDFISKSDLNDYDVWDEERKLWCRYEDSCYTKRTEGGFPYPDKADQEITAITCKTLHSGHYVTWGCKPFEDDSDNEYHLCTNESDLLIQFVGWWSRVKPDIVTGWNIVGFDIPYIVNRITRVVGSDFAERLSPFCKDAKKIFSEYMIQGDQTSYRILGVNILDYMELYKKYSNDRLESYSLNYVSYHELGEKKLDYSDAGSLTNLYEQDYSKFILYNQRDVHLIELLDEKLNFIFLALTMMFMGKVRCQDIFSQVRFWDNMVYLELLKDGIQQPPMQHFKADGIAGAFVKEPTPGMYHWVASLDLTSLYPMITVQCNASPETLARSSEKSNDQKLLTSLLDRSYDTSYLKEEDWSMMANGAAYTRTKRGILPKLINKMFADRKRFKGEMLGVKRQIEELKKEGNRQSEIQLKENEKATLDAKQMALKIALNSLYGASANAHFRYYSTDIAEGITMTGQLVIQYIGNKLNDFLNERLKTSGVDRIIAQDTDSVSGTSMIRTSRGTHSIESLYDNLEGSVKQIRENHFVKEIVDLSVESYSNRRGVELKPVTYIMKHLVEKTMLRVRCRDTDVRMTEDHSIVIYRDGKTVSESAMNIHDTDLLICRHDDGGFVLESDYSVTTLGVCSEWVYDIEVEDNHNFFANDILVHNSCYLNLEDLVTKIVPAGTESDKIVDFIDRFITTYIDPFVESSFDDLAKYLNSFENKMSMKREAIADKALWRKKKHYILRVFDNEGVRYATPQLKIMGIETARSSTPEFVRKALKESIEIIMADDKERLIKFVEDLRAKFFSIPVEEIASPRGISDIDKWKDKGHTWKIGAPIHVKAAILFNRLIEKYNLQNQYPELKNGDKLKFVPLIKQNPVQCNVVGFIDRLPTEFSLERYVDRESQFQSVFLKPLESLTSIIHWNIVEVNTLESFFS